MKRPYRLAVATLIGLAASAATASAQQGVLKSRSSGFFLGVGLEGNGLSTDNSGTTTTESGAGGALLLGYGFSPRWSLYTEVSGANMNADGGGTYTLAHFDVGARVHFRTGPNTVVPFIQFGVSGRGISQDISGSTYQASGAGVSFGGGLNAHFTPTVAFSGSVTWSVGNFSSYKVDNQSVAGDPVNATSARVHLGLVWFPGA